MGQIDAINASESFFLNFEKSLPSISFKVFSNDVLVTDEYILRRFNASGLFSKSFLFDVIKKRRFLLF